MKKIVISILIISLILSATSFGFSKKELIIHEVEEKIFNEIEVTADKVLVVDKIIGDRYVKFWKHVIDDVSVKNDSILLHLDPQTGDILKYEKSWTDVELGLLDFEEKLFEQYNYIWKEKVVFPDEDDRSIAYIFYDPVNYPLVCLIVKYSDGETKLYGSSGDEIGYVVPTPANKGCTLRGYGDTLWNWWRNNANKWFNKWCGDVISKERPTVNQISRYISNPKVEYFYVIAHSGHQPNRFSANDDGVYYYADQLHQDMLGRSPISLAILCCCSAMEDTGPGTLSYEFRKGQITDTVTIGYYDMGSSGSYWADYSIPWQDFMFEKMNDTANYTMKEAFDAACAEYACLEPYVRFVGDENLRVESTVLISSDITTTRNSIGIEPGQSLTFRSVQSETVKEETDKLWLQKINLNNYILTNLIELLRKSLINSH